MKRRSFNFSELVFDRDEYESVKSDLKSEILRDFSIRKQPAEIIINDDVIPTTVGAVLLNLLLISVYVNSEIHLEKEDIIQGNNFSQKDLQKHFNNILNKYKNVENADFIDVRQRIADSLDEMNNISVSLNYCAGDSISFHDFLKLSIEDEKEAEEIFNPKLAKTIQFDEVEKQFKDHTKRIEGFYKNHQDSDLYPFIMSRTGINAKQLTQCIGFVGLKPSISGKVIPVAIDKNYLTGLGNLDNYFINAVGTRLALVTNKTMVRKSGYLTRKLSLLAMDRYHDDNIKDCGTKHFVIYNIDSDRKLGMIENRHYYEIDQDSGQKLSDELHTISRDDTHLIGKKIGLRSPITCCGDHVCATCYGRYLSKVNQSINTGLTAVFRLTEPLTQMLLSAKHLLQTNTDKVEWGEDFLNLFTVNLSNIYFQDGVNAKISFPLPTSDDYDEDEEMYKIRSFEYQTEDSRKPILYESPVDLLVNPKFISDELEDGSEEDRIVIDSNAAGVSDEVIFQFQPKNNELIKSLMEILDLIESSEHLGISDYHNFANKFADLIIGNDMDYIPSVHLEMISSTLIRDGESKERIDFSGDVVPPYSIFRVSKAIMNGPLSISMAFERINDQLTSLDTYKKTKESLLDYLFI